MSTRARYQDGSLTIEKRKSGPDVWTYRWRETAQDGQRIRRKMVVGSRQEYSNRRSALQAFEALKMEINNEATRSTRRSFMIGDLWAHYSEKELEGETFPFHPHRLQTVSQPAHRA